MSKNFLKDRVMSLNVFVSYSHLDRKYVDELRKYLILLEREKKLIWWDDEVILPGQGMDKEIRVKLYQSQIFLAFISQNYIASNYCYYKEFEEALAKENSGEMVIVPIILDHCVWKETPLKKIKALPKDGIPIADYSNPNKAYNYIAEVISRLVEHLNAKERDVLTSNSTLKTEKLNISPQGTVQQSNKAPRIKRDFSEIDRGNFARETFNIIKSSFKQNI